MRPYLVLVLGLLSGAAYGQTPSVTTTSQAQTQLTAAQQRADSTLAKYQQMPEKYAAKAEAKVQSIDNALTAKTQKYLNKLSVLENKILGKLEKLNPSKVQSLAPSTYDKWLGQAPGAAGSTSAVGAGSTPLTYVGGLDTMKTTLAFLQQKGLGGAAQGVTRASQTLFGASAQVTQLQNNLNQANAINQYLAQRRQQLSQLMSQYTNLPGSITNTFNQYKETAYYYKQQVQAYKDMLNDPDKMEAAAMGILGKLPAFQQFLSRNSLLASMFAAPRGLGARQSGP